MAGDIVAFHIVPVDVSTLSNGLSDRTYGRSIFGHLGAGLERLARQFMTYGYGLRSRNDLAIDHQGVARRNGGNTYQHCVIRMQ